MQNDLKMSFIQTDCRSVLEQCFNISEFSQFSISLASSSGQNVPQNVRIDPKKYLSTHQLKNLMKQKPKDSTNAVASFSINIQRFSREKTKDPRK